MLKVRSGSGDPAGLTRAPPSRWQSPAVGDLLRDSEMFLNFDGRQHGIAATSTSGEPKIVTIDGMHRRPVWGTPPAVLFGPTRVSPELAAA